MAYNRWLSSQYSYSPGYDLMHYGRKGMRWGKHIFGLPEITLNGGGGGAVDLEELQKMLEQGKVSFDEFKERAAKHFQDVAAVNKEGLGQVQDRLSDYLKRFSDTYENFKAGDSADKKPDRREYHPWSSAGVDKSKKYDNTDDYDAKKRGDYWIRSSDGSRRTDWELDKEWERNKRADQEEKRSAADRARVNSKIQDRKGLESRDRKENLERKRAERFSTPRTVSKSSNQNGSSKTASKDNYSLEDIVKLAFSSASTSGSTSTGSTRTPNQNKEPKKETYDVTAKQKKIYQTIGKFLNYALTVTNPYHSLRKGLTKQR